MSCGDIRCCDRSPLPRNTVPAMAYVPFQQWPSDIYSAEKGLCQGTLFPCLDLPFMGCGG
ncbi:MAG: spore coat associated protein CotJA [Clostridia bacterium]|nr:spore coat associated protein CotJA [Clostridia bacterium]